MTYLGFWAAFHVDAHQIGAAFVLVGGSHVHDAVEDFLTEGHGGGADGQHALAGLKVGDGLQTLGVSVAEIVAHGPVEVDVHQAGQRIQTVGVNDRLSGFRHGMGNDAAVADHQVLYGKGMLRSVNLGIADNHSLLLACLLKTPAPAGQGCGDQISLRASSSPTRMKSGCICRMEAGTSGVTGPKKAFFTMAALSLPLATSSTLRACMMVLMPMV